MEETLRVLVALGLGLLLVLLRLDAERFGVAEYDETTPEGAQPRLRRRLAWYAIGVALVGGIVAVHPDASGGLGLRPGDRSGVVIGGLGFAAAGSAVVAAYAWWRYRHLRLPPFVAYPGALVNELVTVLVDETAFRGVLLGLLLAAGVDATAAIVAQTLVYGLATRLGASGRDLVMLGLALGIGLAGGWLTVTTGGIGAALVGHAVTRVALFVCTGHAGRPAPRGRETEELEERRRPPFGWRVVGTQEAARDAGRRGREPRER